MAAEHASGPGGERNDGFSRGDRGIHECMEAGFLSFENSILLVSAAVGGLFFAVREDHDDPSVLADFYTGDLAASGTRGLERRRQIPLFESRRTAAHSCAPRLCCHSSSAWRT